MKIEKISNTQVKFLLTGKDLLERGINKNDFHLGSDKIKNLIKEITEQAALTCGFEPDEHGATPIMIEAAPFENDGILIIVSKVNNSYDIKEKFNAIPETLSERHYIQGDIKESPFTITDKSNIAVYSFDSIDGVERACKAGAEYYKGAGSLYKLNNRFYLLLLSDNINITSYESFDILMNEFGQKHISNLISKGYLSEYGEIIIENNAFNIMAEL